MGGSRTRGCRRPMLEDEQLKQPRKWSACGAIVRGVRLSSSSSSRSSSSTGSRTSGGGGGGSDGGWRLRMCVRCTAVCATVSCAAVLSSFFGDGEKGW